VGCHAVQIYGFCFCSSQLGIVEVISGPEELTQPAIDAVQKWRYRPYLSNSEPAERETQVTLVYTLAPAPDVHSASQ
jgi:protein TonB